MTKRETYAVLRRIVENAPITNKVDMLAFIDHEIELLNNKKSNATETAKQKENNSIKELIVECLKDAGKPITLTELQKNYEELSPEKYSNQKLSALVRQLVESEVVKKSTNKRVSYFYIGEDGAES